MRRLLAVTVMACAALLVQVSPAQAAGVQETVQLGQTWTAQWLDEDRGDVCHDGDWFRQLIRVEWNMQVQSEGIYVNSVVLKIWNYSSKEPLTVGRKTVYGATAYQPWGYDNAYITNGESWTRTLTVNRFFAWQYGKFVNFRVAIAVLYSSFGDSLFQLKKGF